jgi:mono/diheme cytochrome c family protein
MRYVRLAILTLGIGIGVVASAQTSTKTGSKANLATGGELFHQNCSVCHGVDGKGPSPGSTYDPESIEPQKRVKPANLTILSEQNAGEFPADRVRDAIYFKGSIPEQHGTPEMPAWGNVFYLLKSRPKVLKERLRELSAYIESIQTTKK